MKGIMVVACFVLLLTLVSPTLSRADVAPAAAPAPTGPVDYKQLYEEQKKRNDELEKRISILEEKDAAEPYVTKESLPEATLNFIQQTEISGYVSSSYFYNFNNPAEHLNTGRGFDYLSDEFMINKVVLTLTKSVEYNPFDWAAGYEVQTIFGQDAEFTQASGLDLGTDGDLFIATVTVNVPVGNGLQVTAGKFGTMIGYEASLTEENANWSGGNQWTFLEPFTHTGLHSAYKPTGEIEVQFCVMNGWDNVVDNNNSKSFMGYVNYAPNDNTSVSVTGYGGPEQDDNNSNWRRGVDMVVSQKFSPKFTGVCQVDYGAESGAKVVGVGVDANGDPVAIEDGTAEWWGVGVWGIYDFTEKVQAAVRWDFVDDINGARTSDAPSRNPYPINRGQQIQSVTLTLNFKPLEQLRVSPEFRWDRSTLDDAYDGHEEQVTVGVGAAYFY